MIVAKIAAKTPCALFSIPTACVTSTTGGNPITGIAVNPECSEIEYYEGKIRYVVWDENDKEVALMSANGSHLYEIRDTFCHYENFQSQYYSNVSTTVLSNCDDNTYTIKACPTIQNKPMIIGNKTLLPCSPYYSAEAKAPVDGCDAPIVSLTPQPDCSCKGLMSLIED